jgi:hypothetical protein
LASPRTRYTPVHDQEEDDLKNVEKIAKACDCENMKYYKARKGEEKDNEHIGDCVREVPEEEEETENIYQSIDGPEIEIVTQSSYHWQKQAPIIKEKRCTCVRVKRSQTIQNEAELKKYRAFYQRGGRYSRDRLWSNASSGNGYNKIQTQEFNTLEKIFFCLACMFD